MKKKINLLVVFMLVLSLACGAISTVSAATKPTKMTISASSKVVYVGTQVKVQVDTVTPENASKAVTFKTSNKKIAAVSSKGVVTGKKAGKVTITATSKLNKKLKKTVKITVKSAKSKIDELKGITFPKNFTISKGGDFIFVTNCTIKKNLCNTTKNAMIVIDEGTTFAPKSVFCIKNSLKVGKDDPMPKFSGGNKFTCEGCGSATAFENATFNGVEYVCDKSSVTGIYRNLTTGEEISAPAVIDAIEIVQYYEDGVAKIVVNGMAW